MNSLSTSTISLTAVVLGCLVLVGCSSAPAENVGLSEPSSTQNASATPEPAPDLSGEWKQTNSQSDDSYQAATISGDTIEINWVSNNGDTRSLYWAGTFAVPTEAGSFTFDSVNDTDKTDVAMLASGDPTKTFSYADGEISYEASALGSTTTVRLAR